jgi:hypothetical protein
MALEHFFGPWPLLQFRNKNGGIVPLILNFGTRWRWVVNFTPRSFSRGGKSPRYPTDKGLHEPQSRFKRCGGQKNLLSVTISSYVGTKLVFSTTILCPRERFDCSNIGITNLNSASIVNICLSSSVLTCKLRPCKFPICYPKRLNKGLKSC